MVELGLEPPLQFSARAGVDLGRGRFADQHDLGRRICLELVLDRLDDVLVADPGLRLDSRLGQRRNRRHQVPLRRLAGRLDIGRPAVEKADPRRREDEDVGFCRAQLRGADDLSNGGRILDGAGRDEKQVAAGILRREPS